ncbi:ATPase [Lelliottia aquatilis]|uniref:ParA family protein n=1 Tax=Lelliottia aquatilis TaxID=2080838 RepID=UPI000CDE8909|nr:ParA family protein [Lelliottia aquatilis]POZ13654.1 ATPase [Lelliottia aquatilis]
MTISIAFASGKGGVTKSTLARAVAVSYAKSNWKVLAGDLDIGQGTFVNWNRRRMSAEIEPVFDVLSLGTVTQLKKHLDSEQYDLAIADCAAFASKSTIEIANLCDLTVIPTSFSLDDLESTVNTANSLVRSGVPAQKLAIAFSGVSENESDYEAARGYLAKTPYTVIDGFIPRKPALSKAQDGGRSIIECPYAAPRQRAEHVIQGIINRIEELTSEE